MDGQHTSLEMPEQEENHVASGGLDFLPSNFDFDPKLNDSSNTKNSDPDSVLNLDNYESTTPSVRHRGNIGNMMDKYGIGWLLDQNNHEIEKEDSLPLLEELDIDLTGIKYKIQCVIMPIKNQNLNRSVLRDDPGKFNKYTIKV